MCFLCCEGALPQRRSLQLVRINSLFACIETFKTVRIVSTNLQRLTRKRLSKQQKERLLQLRGVALTLLTLVVSHPSPSLLQSPKLLHPSLVNRRNVHLQLIGRIALAMIESPALMMVRAIIPSHGVLSVVGS